MGVTLIAILTAAMLLPGIIASHQFYTSAETSEADVFVPPLTTSGGLALIGVFSAATHILFILCLVLIDQWPPLIPLPLMDPYRFFSGVPDNFDYLDAVRLIGGICWLCLLAVPIGRLVSAYMMEKGDAAVFYGPMTQIIQESQGDEAFVAAYVLTKIDQNGYLIGYQGVVSSLIPDQNKVPRQITLTDVSVFLLEIDGDDTQRIETDQRIGWLTITSDDWHNIAFKVFVDVDFEEIPAFVSAQELVDWQRVQNRINAHS